LQDDRKYREYKNKINGIDVAQKSFEKDGVLQNE
jgi:hypothetical protein